MGSRVDFWRCLYELFLFWECSHSFGVKMELKCLLQNVKFSRHLTRDIQDYWFNHNKHTHEIAQLINILLTHKATVIDDTERR